jgi:hypothetical protein
MPVPLVLLYPASKPTAVLLDAVLENKAVRPNAVLLNPLNLDTKKEPIAVLLNPRCITILTPNNLMPNLNYPLKFAVNAL